MSKRILNVEEALKTTKRARELLEKGEIQYFDNIITEKDYRFNDEQTNSTTASPVTLPSSDKIKNTLFQIRLDVVLYILIGIICFLIAFLSIATAKRRKRERLSQASNLHHSEDQQEI